jgi:two-component system NtrC family response regulator
MPEISGMTILEESLKKEGTEVMMMTAYGTAETAVEAMKKGAADYLLKPFGLDELEMIVAKIAEKQKQSALVDHYRSQEAAAAAQFIGKSEAAERVKKMLAKVAGSGATVLLTGRSGTGKEVAARMIHQLSPRADKPFIAVNCAALPENLLESELFGHEKGSFTGAVSRKRGRFEVAEGGSIFLDEIAETTNAVQSKLLRVLEEKTLHRVGGVDPIDIDVRVIAATNRDLKSEMKQGRFREDLFYRLNVFPIDLPSLAERRDDVLLLARHFLKELNYPHVDVSDEVAALLSRYDWPGNVRELKNVIERATILAGGEPLSAEDFSLEVDDAPLVDSGAARPDPSSGLENTEKQMILQALEKTGGNKTEAARLLKISRRRLYSRMKVHGIEP